MKDKRTAKINERLVNMKSRSVKIRIWKMSRSKTSEICNSSLWSMLSRIVEWGYGGRDSRAVVDRWRNFERGVNGFRAGSPNYWAKLQKAFVAEHGFHGTPRLSWTWTSQKVRRTETCQARGREKNDVSRHTSFMGFNEDVLNRYLRRSWA